MSRLSGYFGARKGAEESEPIPAPDAESRAESSRDPIFDLVPPPSASAAAPGEGEQPPGGGAEKSPQSDIDGRNVHTIGISDLSRLSIDNDGRLYWDGKPVEVRRRILMSRPQIVGACIVAAFVVIGAVGAAVHGSAAALDWACRLGWTTNYCSMPDAAPPPAARPDIPA
jgi:hypothetical protein